ncbi:hypothetical protein D3C72_1494880 [compost metagenome]
MAAPERRQRARIARTGDGQAVEQARALLGVIHGFGHPSQKIRVRDQILQHGDGPRFNRDFGRGQPMPREQRFHVFERAGAARHDGPLVRQRIGQTERAARTQRVGGARHHVAGVFPTAVRHRDDLVGVVGMGAQRQVDLARQQGAGQPVPNPFHHFHLQHRPTLAGAGQRGRQDLTGDAAHGAHADRAFGQAE